VAKFSNKLPASVYGTTMHSRVPYAES